MHTITITPEQANGRFEPARGRYRPMVGTNGRFLLRVTDNRIVTQKHDQLTDIELAALRKAWKTAVNGRKQVNPAELDRKWAETAVEGELDRIIGLHGDHPHKPDSEYWKCLLRIAGVVKGAGKATIRPSEILVKLLRFTPHDMKWKLANRERDITYLWGRAMNRAPARYRDEKTN